MVEFEPYHIHTSYSNALTQPDSTMFISDYAKVYRERGHKVLCMSEHGNRSNVWEQFDICEAYKNDKNNPYEMTPLAAAEVYFVPDRIVETDGKKDGRNFHLILIAKNQEGFYQLNEIISEANLTGFYRHARVDFDLLGRLNYKNFLCTTACFTKGTLVKTANGFKPIENITSDDYIYNKFGEWEKVNYPTTRKYIGNGKEIHIKGETRTITCTETHKFLTTCLDRLNYYNKTGKDPFVWKEAKELRINKISNNSKDILVEPIEHIKYNNNNIILKTEWKNKLVQRKYSVKHPISDQIKLTPEVMRLFGLWLGDGHISIRHETNYYNVGISFAKDEFNYYWESFVKQASEEIGVIWSINETKHNKIELSSRNVELTELYAYLFGNRKADTKIIPERLLNISEEANDNLIFGMMLADGYFRTQEKDGYKYGQCVYRSISENLINNMCDILHSMGIRTGNVRKDKEHTDKDGTHHKQSYSLQINNNAFINISKRHIFSSKDVNDLFMAAKSNCENLIIEVEGVKYKKKYIDKINDVTLNTDVHCLNVDSHSFVCEGVVVHNCVAGIWKDENFERLACQLGEIFRENFYLEVQHHPQQIQIETNMKALRLYQRYHWPLIYGTDSHYINKEDKILRTELMLSKGISYGDEDSFDLHLPTAEEAYQMLSNQGVLTKARIEEAMENTLVLREFEGVHFTKEKKIPNAYPEKTLEERNQFYKETCMKEYIRKAGTPTEYETKELENEMDAVADTGTSDYFLLCKRIVDRGREFGGVVTNTGRGSGSSFATNFALGFTTLNRLHSPVKLYPERFISKERMAAGILPDLDINLTNVEAFERAGQEILGEFGCLPMINYGTLKALSAFKLLAKARDIDFETANAVSKQIQAYELDVKHAIENNADDPDYNVDDDILIDSYIEERYLDLVEASKKYLKIILTIGPHPCAHLLLDKDIRREIGVVRIKGDKIVAYIDGATADAYGYLKLDLLRVTVVEIIAKAFERIGLPVMSVDELLDKVKDDKEVWDLYAKGLTQGLNQCEQPKSTERVMRYKPRNIVEQSLFVAAIRPGFKSMLETFISRTPFSYHIKSLDELLQTKEIPDSFLAYDEQVLSILISAGIPAADAYVCLKAIKKKKFDKVEAFKDRFRDGFAKHLEADEGATPEEAAKIVDNVWGIIEASASYLFNASHSLCMACDSLYVAWLKAHYPYELYVTMLKIFSEKKNKNKVAAIIAEMKRYMNIQLLAGVWKQDNRDWLIDKPNHRISQDVASIRYMSSQMAEDLYNLSQQEEAYIGSEFTSDVFKPEVKKEISKLKKQLKPLQQKAEELLNNGADEFSDEFLAVYDKGYSLEQRIKQLESDDNSYLERAREIKHYVKMDCFTNVLRAIQMNTTVDTRQIEILIGLNYFQEFGKPGKLMNIYHQFYEGENKLTKTIKSFNSRLELCRQYENSLEDSDLKTGLRLRYEMDNVGLCLSTCPSMPSNAYFVTSVDDKYSIKMDLDSMKRGTAGQVKVSKKNYHIVDKGSCIIIDDFKKSPRYTYNKGQRTIVPGETDIWLTKYHVMTREEAG